MFLSDSVLRSYMTTYSHRVTKHLRSIMDDMWKTVDAATPTETEVDEALAELRQNIEEESARG